MKQIWRLILLFSILIGFAGIVPAQDSTSVNNLSTVKIRGRTSVPSGCTTSTALFYYDLTSHQVKVCVNGGAFSNWTSGSAEVGGSGTSGQVTYWNETNTITGAAAFVWDNANSRLGINRATPSAIFHIDSENLTPASIGTSPGTIAPTLFRIGKSATGGTTTIATTGVGGIGSSWNLNTGDGGIASAAAVASTGGDGGGSTLALGNGGAAKPHRGDGWSRDYRGYRRDRPT